MAFDPSKHHRRSIRMPGYDYRQSGAYFITICTHERELLFADRDAADIAEFNWAASFVIRKELEPDEFVVMPNHIHAIVWISNPSSPTTNRPADDASSVGAQGLRPYRRVSTLPRQIMPKLGSRRRVRERCCRTPPGS